MGIYRVKLLWPSIFANFSALSTRYLTIFGAQGWGWLAHNFLRVGVGLPFSEGKLSKKPPGLDPTPKPRICFTTPNLRLWVIFSIIFGEKVRKCPEITSPYFRKFISDTEFLRVGQIGPRGLLARFPSRNEQAPWRNFWQVHSSPWAPKYREISSGQPQKICKI